MTDPQLRLSNNYTPAFLVYLNHPDEGTLHTAYELGRAALADGISLLELVRIHHTVIGEILRATPTPRHPDHRRRRRRVPRRSTRSLRNGPPGFLERANPAPPSSGEPNLDHNHRGESLHHLLASAAGACRPAPVACIRLGRCAFRIISWRTNPMTEGAGPSSELFDLVVIGGGVMGMFTAWTAAQHGSRVAVLERGRGRPATASYGRTRSYRRDYLDAGYARLADEAIRLWAQFERRPARTCWCAAAA